MKIKIIFAFVIVMALIGILLIPSPIGEYVFFGVFSILTILASYEILKTIKTDKIKLIDIIFLTVSVISLFSVLIMYTFFAYFFPYPLFIVFVVPIISLVLQRKNNTTLNVVLVGTTFVGMGFAGLIFLRHLGVYVVIYLFIVTMVTDSCAQLGGMLFGKRKLAPNISPKKTIEGAIVGTVLGTTIASIFGILLGALTSGDGYLSQLINPDKLDTILSMVISNKVLAIVLIIIISFCASIVGQIGDLIASKIKRMYNVKDYSNIIPGHGGIIDRFDSTLLVSIFFSVLVLIFFIFTL